MDTLVAALDAALPQTQCTRCGYPRCRAYAKALSAGQTAINRCPPGGDTTIARLAELLHTQVLVPDPAYGGRPARTRAVIDETLCIGCRKCLDVCPVDAIIGSRKRMHTVLAAECNGCALCLPPCPVDCIALVPVHIVPDPASLWLEYTCAESARWRTRTDARLARLARKKSRRAHPRPAADHERARMRAEIRAAVERVRARRRAREI